LAAAASVVMMAIACALCAVYAAQAMQGSSK
jgi:multiple sugar transport system permease protein